MVKYLITGGTGSFGRTVLKYLIKKKTDEIRVFSRDELKQQEMRDIFNISNIQYYIGDVRDAYSLHNAMQGVDYVFHAAALKQVPSCEFFPMEAVKTNIIGTDNVLNAAIEAGVKKVVCLSTDKAAYPINAMGISKAMMEKVFLAKARQTDPSKTIICGTRYGNVMASRGSVIPLFVEQIKKGLPITITNPKMTRYLMSLEEAVELVMYAFEHGQTGDIFVQKADASTIGDLAQAMLELFNAKNEIKIIGARHGEKLYETLLTKEEFAKAIDLGKFYRIPADMRDLNYNLYFTEGDESVSLEQEYNSHNTKLLSVEEIKQKLFRLEYIQQELESWNKK